MRLDLFREGDNVLLLGEGNFSFARNLLCHNLPIKLTVSCYHEGIKHENEQENIQFLLQNDIPVFHGVDATNLHENCNLRDQKFSKVVFNFPHIGGKMKIHLNRELIKNVCISVSRLLSDDGLLIVSLCSGQGGTPCDEPARKWSDSWQIVEMAAHGDLCLIAVEPFDISNFQLYSCTGYRSQDVYFNLKGALVHILKKKVTLTKIIDDDAALERLSLVPITKDSEIFVPYYYAQLYGRNPLNNSESGISFFRKLLVNCHEDKNSVKSESGVRFLTDEDIPIFVECNEGVCCQVNGSNKYRLRHSAAQIIMPAVEKHHANGGRAIFPGVYFNFDLGVDFQNVPPISIQFLLLGDSVSDYFYHFTNLVMSTFKRDDLELCRHLAHPNCHQTEGCINSFHLKRIPNCRSITEWCVINRSGTTDKTVIAHELVLDVEKSDRSEICVLYMDAFMEIFFGTRSWKEAWSDESRVCHNLKAGDSPPVFRPGLLYPSSYTFDVTLRHDEGVELVESDVYEILRISAVDIITGVEVVNVYRSGMGWSSKCFRITYQSWNEPLYRERVIDIHSRLISKMLSLALPAHVK